MGGVVSSAGRLIIVDDEPVILNLLTSVFDDEPYKVVSCKDGSSALAAMEEGGVDVLLTDKNLPDIGGLELLQHAKHLQMDAEGIIITGYASLDTVLAAMQLDAFDYIVKPPKDIFDVKRKVRQAFSKIDMGRENRRLLGVLQERNDRLEQALSDLQSVQAELIQSEKLAGIGTLAAGIAHEISSPLFGVMGLAEAIVEEESRELVHGYAREIVEYSRTIKDIVVQLSGYSRSAEMEYHTTIDLPAVIDDAVRLVTRSLSIHPDTVVVTRQEGDIYVNARTSELQQVFVNLVKNAVEAVMEHHGDDGDGRVNVSCGRSEGHVWARVQDNGPGIDEAGRTVIFDPFFTTKPPGRGTGLGLNIVYRICTKYRGTVAVEETQGEGATFLVCFPIDVD
jgi:signal transduction histidine kinase